MHKEIQVAYHLRMLLEGLQAAAVWQRIEWGEELDVYV